MLLVIDADGTERTLIDPMEVDPTGTTTLDAWQPSKEGHLLAYQLSEGGTEESVLRVMDVGTGEDRRRTDRPGALLPRRLGARRKGVLLRAAPPCRGTARRRGAVPPPGLVAPARHAPRDNDVMIFGDGLDPTNYYGVSVSLDGRWLSITAAAGTEPRNDLWVADLMRPRQRDLSSSPCKAEWMPRRTAVRPQQPGVRIHQLGRAPRAHHGDRARRLGSLDSGPSLVPEHPESVLEGWSVLDGEELDEPVLLVARSHHAVGRKSPAPTCSTARNGHRSDARDWHRRRAQRPSRRWSRGMVRIHRPHHPVVGVPLRRAH